MLVLSRKVGERVLIGDDIVVTVLDVRGEAVRVGIEAPSGIRIQRHEIVQAVIEANLAATSADESAADLLRDQLDVPRPPAG